MKYYIKDNTIIKIEESFDEIIEGDFGYNVMYQDGKIMEIEAMSDRDVIKNNILVAKAKLKTLIKGGNNFCDFSSNILGKDVCEKYSTIYNKEGEKSANKFLESL